MSKSDDIRRLAAAGIATADIARKLSIRYQHAYKVLRDAGVERSGARRVPRPPGDDKPRLLTRVLKRSGFSIVSRWVLSENGELRTKAELPREIGVYAFAIDGVVMYVGVATMGIARRLRFYGKPGSTQKTSLRLNKIIRAEAMKGIDVEILAAFPPDQSWNGLPVHGSTGLELGLIKAYALPWNIRGAKH